MVSASQSSTENSFSDVDRVYNLQEESLQKLKNLSVKERIQKLKKIREFLKVTHNQRKLEEAFMADFKKPAAEVQVTEILPVFGHLSEIIKNLSRWTRPKSLEVGIAYTGLNARVIYEPKGQALIIAPWNYPFLLSVYPVLYAMAAGCSVVLKPSELTPATSQFIADMFHSLFEESAVKVIQGAVPVTTHLLDKKWAHIFFTGSPAVGKIVMKAASKHLTSVSLELGGKSPCIVDETANLKACAKRMVWGKFVNAGQTCIAPDYLLIQENVKDRFIDLMKKEVNAFYGASAQNSDSLARIISKKHYDRLVGMIEDAQKKGANVILGGGKEDEDLFIAPTILDAVTEEMDVMKEEIFGPVLPMMTFEKLEEIPVVMNKMYKPLSMYICSSNKKNIKYLIAQSSAGGTVVNDFLMGAAIPTVPFGGINNSGIGKAFGHHGFIEFSNERSVIKRSFGHINFMYPPYNKRVTQIVNVLKKIM